MRQICLEQRVDNHPISVGDFVFWWALSLYACRVSDMTTNWFSWVIGSLCTRHCNALRLPAVYWRLWWCVNPLDANQTMLMQTVYVWIRIRRWPICSTAISRSDAIICAIFWCIDRLVRRLPYIEERIFFGNGRYSVSKHGNRRGSSGDCLLSAGENRKTMQKYI